MGDAHEALLRRLRAPVDRLLRPEPAPVEDERSLAHPRELVGTELAHLHEHENLVLLAAPRRDADIADPGRVVLQLVAVAPFERVGLVDDEDVVVAPERHAGPRTEPLHLRGVAEVDRRRVALPVARRPGPRVGTHEDARLRAGEARDPRVRRAVEASARVVLLGVLAEVPNVAGIVLGEERQLALLQPAGAD